MKTASAAAALTAVTVAIYWGALSAGFVGDDFMILHRLRDADGAGAWRFFRGEFFEYYRPLGFVAHWLDWRIAGANAWQFHATNLLLHVVSAILVLLIGCELSPRTWAGPIAALLFALHAANHEAVVWISARFDLLATCFSLAAVWLTVRRDGRAWLLPAVTFLCAILSKEAAVGLPIAVAGFAVFRLRAGRWDTARRLAPWLAALAVYSVARQVAGGVSTIGGAAKLPKLAAFFAILGILVLLAGNRWLTARKWLAGRGGVVAAAIAAAMALLAILAAFHGGTGLAADKLAVAGFASFNLLSPVLDVFGVPFYLDPGTTRYWLGGVVAVGAAAALGAVAWRRIRDDDRQWFLCSFLVAGLLPVSALTEGTRYLYLPSAAVSLIVAVAVSDLIGRERRFVLAAIGAAIAVSSGQIVKKTHDWQWAGRLTADGARMVDASLAPSCGQGHVVFLIEPVALRSVYTHFLYETFELPRGCMPGTFQILVRMVRVDSPIEARWSGPREIVITAPAYAGNLSLSHDLRQFDPPLRSPDPFEMVTPVGTIRGERIGANERLRLSLAPDVDPAQTRFFYYSGGRMQPLGK